MLQYLIILLDEKSTSFCHYKVPADSSKGENALMPLETLRKGIRFGMMENLMIQYVYPDVELPSEYSEVIESIDHSKIKSLPQPLLKEGRMDADVWVVDSIKDIKSDVPVVWRTAKRNCLLVARQASSRF